MGSLANGVSRSMSCSAATDSTSRAKYWVRAPAHGAIAPSFSESEGSGMTSSGSASYVVPSPLHTLHAPYGELNENDRGASTS